MPPSNRRRINSWTKLIVAAASDRGNMVYELYAVLTTIKYSFKGIVYICRDLCDNIGLVLVCLSCGNTHTYVTASTSCYDPAIWDFYVYFLYVGHPVNVKVLGGII